MSCPRSIRSRSAIPAFASLLAAATMMSSATPFVLSPVPLRVRPPVLPATPFSRALSSARRDSRRADVDPPPPRPRISPSSRRRMRRRLRRRIRGFLAETFWPILPAPASPPLPPGQSGERVSTRALARKKLRLLRSSGAVAYVCALVTLTIFSGFLLNLARNFVAAAYFAAGAAGAEPFPPGAFEYRAIRSLALRLLGGVYLVSFCASLRQNRGLLGDHGLAPARDFLEEAKERGRRNVEMEDNWYNDLYGGEKNSTMTWSTPAKGMEEWPAPIRWLEENRADLFPDLSGIDAWRAWSHEVRYKRLPVKIREFLSNTDRRGRFIPTLLWLVRPSPLPSTNSTGDGEPSHSLLRLDVALDFTSFMGVVLSLPLILTGTSNVPTSAALYILHLSLSSVGEPFYSYGWESLLSEIGAICTLALVPLKNTVASASRPVPITAVFAMRWLAFRIMLGAGLIKLRSHDRGWRNGEAMSSFYETMPVPGPLSKFFHRMPRRWHVLETYINHVVELLLPWLLILPGVPRSWRIRSAATQVAFQGILILSGNFAFLNWLTIVPILFALDDSAAFATAPRSIWRNAQISTSLAHYLQREAAMGRPALTQALVNALGTLLSHARDIFFVGAVALLSVPVVKNLMSKKQQMNTTFGPLKLVNTYGAFGTVERERVELIVESAKNVTGPWREHEFKVKPGNIHRPPRWITPYHHRIDWQMWIASVTGPVERSPWMYTLLLRLLRSSSEDLDVVGLLDVDQGDPWWEEREVAEKAAAAGEGDGDPGGPRYIRVEKYRYAYKYGVMEGRDMSEEKRGNLETKPYWTRERVGKYYPLQGVATVESLKEEVERTGGRI